MKLDLLLAPFTTLTHWPGGKWKPSSNPNCRWHAPCSRRKTWVFSDLLFSQSPLKISVALMELAVFILTWSHMPGYSFSSKFRTGSLWFWVPRCFGFLGLLFSVPPTEWLKTTEASSLTAQETGVWSQSVPRATRLPGLFQFLRLLAVFVLCQV